MLHSDQETFERRYSYKEGFRFKLSPTSHPSFFLRLINSSPAASSCARADSAKRGRPISFVTAARAASYRARFDFLGFTAS